MRWRDSALPALVVLWAAWAFAPLLGGYFLSDDFVPLVLFEHWREEGRLASALAEKFWSGLDAGENRFYRPLSYLTFAASFLVNGTAAAPWMAVNVAVHLANGVLVAVIAALIADDRLSARSTAAGAAGAALFLFFAPSAEVVAWVSGRFDAFATFFTLLACASFLRSRRSGDAAWIAALLCAIAALLSKESAAIVPFAIVLLAWYRSDAGLSMGPRATAALRQAWPWLALAGAYLAWRYFIFGSAFAVYGHSHPASAMFSASYWREVGETFPVWFSQQFRNPTLYPLLCTFAVAQLVVVAAGWPAGRRARDGLIASAAIVALTVGLLLPHVGRLPADGLGGRLLYQTAAFYGVFVAVVLVHSRLPRTLWSVTLVLGVANAALQSAVLDRWHEAHRRMPEVVSEVARVGGELRASDYALILVPSALDDIPFARNAQAGLMLRPVQREPLSAKLLVQVYDELPLLADRISQGIVATMRQRSVFDYLGGGRVVGPIEYPNAVLCWDAGARRLIALEAGAGTAPQQWAQEVKRAFGASRCARCEESRGCFRIS